jgi:predicted DNA-binding transcriptional regulator AlpA
MIHSFLRSRSVLIRAVQEVLEPEALRVAAAAARIGISEQELRRLIHRGEGPEFVMIGKVTMIRQVAIDRWLAQKEAASRKVLKANRALVKKFDVPKVVKTRATKF